MAKTVSWRVVYGRSNDKRTATHAVREHGPGYTVCGLRIGHTDLVWGTTQHPTDEEKRTACARCFR